MQVLLLWGWPLNPGFKEVIAVLLVARELALFGLFEVVLREARVRLFDVFFVVLVLVVDFDWVGCAAA
jgi:hypothetical protein